MHEGKLALLKAETVKHAILTGYFKILIFGKAVI
jgi:hypothetical protein